MCWKTPEPTAFILNKNVHIWQIRYDECTKHLVEIKSFLSGAEIKRAMKFHFKIDQNRFIVTRGLLKKILSRIISEPVGKISFNNNEYGKPYLKKNDLPFFNVSHSGNLGLIAITNISEIGVDVEQYRINETTEDIARRFFSKDEVKSYLSLDLKQRQEGFFNCWTRKEAFIKAMGMGLSLSLQTFDVTLKPGEEVRLLNVRFKSENASNWILQDIRVDPGYAAAFALKAQNIEINYWNACKLSEFEPFIS